MSIYIYILTCPKVIGASRVIAVTWFMTMSVGLMVVEPSQHKQSLFPALITIWFEWCGDSMERNDTWSHQAGSDGCTGLPYSLSLRPDRCYCWNFMNFHVRSSWFCCWGAPQSRAGLGNRHGGFTSCVHNHLPKYGLSLQLGLNVRLNAGLYTHHPSIGQIFLDQGQMGHSSVCHTNLMRVNLHLTFVIQSWIA